MFRLRKLGFIGFVMLSLMASFLVMSKECAAVVSDDEKSKLKNITSRIEAYSVQLEVKKLDDSDLNKFQRPADLNLPLAVDDITFVFCLFQREEVGQSVLRRIPVTATGVNVVGDLHGKLPPTIRQMHNALSNNRHVLFLGDFVDRGAHSIEVTVYLLAMRLLYRDRVFLNRGDHETLGIMQSYGTIANGFGRPGEIQKYRLDYSSPKDGPLVDSWFAAFNYLPWAAVLEFPDRRPGIYCAHGGFGPNTVFTDLGGLNLPINVEEEHVDDFNAIAWSDPDPHVIEYKDSSRGAGFIYGPLQFAEFCTQNGVDMVLRGHQHENDAQVNLKSLNLKSSTEKQCLTVMGASKIKGMNNWTGSFCHVSPDGCVVVFDYETEQEKLNLRPVYGPVPTALVPPVVSVVKPVMPLRSNSPISTRSKLFYKFTDSGQIKSIDLGQGETIKDVQTRLNGSITGAVINGSEVSDFNDTPIGKGGVEYWGLGREIPAKNTGRRVGDFLEDTLSHYRHELGLVPFYLIIEPNTFLLPFLIGDMSIPRTLKMQKNWTLAEYFKQKQNDITSAFKDGVNDLPWSIKSGNEDEIKLDPQTDIVFEKIKAKRWNPDEVSLCFDFPEGSLNSGQVQVVDTPASKRISDLSDDEAGKILGQDRFNFKVGVNEDLLALNFPSGLKVSDARKKLAELFNVNNMYEKKLEVADITLLFSGKTLRDGFKLNRLKVGEKPIIVYVRDVTEIVLVTARAMRMPVLKESIKGGLPSLRRSGGGAVVGSMQPASAAPKENEFNFGLRINDVWH
ncbi:MAG: metallophosphoesterase, partial [Streptococcaceae bacterium]|nr:metallophosphoesterase [Streptococcaceae bacterium]